MLQQNSLTFRNDSITANNGNINNYGILLLMVFLQSVRTINANDFNVTAVMIR